MSQIWINGSKLTSMEPITLKPYDRLIFGTGTNSIFLFRNTSKDSEIEAGSVTDDPVITHYFTVNERYENENKEKAAERENERLAQEKQAEELRATLQEKMDAERKEAEEQQKKLQKEFEQ